jgi:putative ABC transport system ATP-binding protein
MGASGSGKSTLLHCLAALEVPTTGKVFIGDTDVSRLSHRERAWLRRDRIGFVFQAFNLVPTLDAYENIILPQRLANRTPDHRWVDRVIDQVGLGNRLNHRPAELSGGQQQRVAVARALAGRPQIIYADEPTGNLDTRSGHEVLSLLRAAVDEHAQTIVMVTHDPMAAAYADRVVFLGDGRLVDELRDPTADAVLERLKSLGGFLPGRDQGRASRAGRRSGRSPHSPAQELRNVTGELPEVVLPRPIRPEVVPPIDRWDGRGRYDDDTTRITLREAAHHREETTVLEALPRRQPAYDRRDPFPPVGSSRARDETEIIRTGRAPLAPEPADAEVEERLLEEVRAVWDRPDERVIGFVRAALRDEPERLVRRRTRPAEPDAWNEPVTRQPEPPRMPGMSRRQPPAEREGPDGRPARPTWRRSANGRLTRSEALPTAAPPLPRREVPTAAPPPARREVPTAAPPLPRREVPTVAPPPPRREVPAARQETETWRSPERRRARPPEDDWGPSVASPPPEPPPTPRPARPASPPAPRPAPPPVREDPATIAARWLAERDAARAAERRAISAGTPAPRPEPEPPPRYERWQAERAEGAAPRPTNGNGHHHNGNGNGNGKAAETPSNGLSAYSPRDEAARLLAELIARGRRGEEPAPDPAVDDPASTRRQRHAPTYDTQPGVESRPATRRERYAHTYDTAGEDAGGDDGFLPPARG